MHASNSPLGLPPNPPVAEAAKQQLDAGLQRFEEKLSKGPYVAGEQLTFADCTLFAALQFGEFFGVTVGDEFPQLGAWYQRFKQRPSTEG